MALTPCLTSAAAVVAAQGVFWQRKGKNESKNEMTQ